MAVKLWNNTSHAQLTVIMMPYSRDYYIIADISDCRDIELLSDIVVQVLQTFTLMFYANCRD